MSDREEMAGSESVRKALSKARSSIRLEGEIVHRAGGGIAIRRGGSVFEVAANDILEVRELEDKQAVVLVKAEAQLVRSTALVSKWFGGRIGWRPVFDDCSDCADCTDCSACGDCTECSVCSDCTECSVCSDCTECSVCSDCTECSVCADCTECSVGGLGGITTVGQNAGFQALSSFIRRLSGIQMNKFRRSKPNRRKR